MMFEAVADTIATAIHNADLYRSEQWRRQVADDFAGKWRAWSRPMRAWTMCWK